MFYVISLTCGDASVSVCLSVHTYVRTYMRPCLSVCLSVRPSVCPSVWVLYIIFGFVSTYACFMLCYAFVTPGHASVRLSVYFFFISAYYVFYKLNTPIHSLRSLFLFFKTTKIRLYVRPSVCSLVV